MSLYFQNTSYIYEDKLLMSVTLIQQKCNVILIVTTSRQVQKPLGTL